MNRIRQIRRHWMREDGFTMLFALLALFVGSLLIAAAFTAADGDIKLSGKATVHTKAYYAAQAGVQRYLYEIQKNPNYWIKCPKISTRKISKGELEQNEAPEEEYTVETLPSASYEKNKEKCKENVQASVLETTGAAAGTFRILSTSKAGSGTNAVEHKIVATFSHPGFTKYVYESNYEVEDPTNFSPEPTTCEHYYKERVEKKLTTTCPPIEFAPEDEVKGPMHTNDAAEICAEGNTKPVFGRKGREDAIEMLGGHYAAGGCSNSPEILGVYTEEAEALLPPETDGELLETAGDKFSGRTEITLKAGSPNTMTVTNKGSTSTKDFPSNGVIYVENSSEGCAVSKYSPFDTDTIDDTGCGDVYVHGTYTESLTIASADDVIVNGNLTTTGGSEGGEPTGSATLGLIAENFVRVYHPVKTGYSRQYEEPKSEAATSEEIATETCGTGYVKRTGTLVSENGFSTHKKEIKELSSTSGISSGMNVVGTYISSGTTVSSVKTSAVELSAYPSKNSVREEVWFYKSASNGYEYVPALKRCVKPPETGWTYNESENLDVKGSCETGTTAGSKGFCEYENNSKTCSSKATNLSASEDPNKWGALTNPIIDAAILSTKHSWIVDNYKCGAKLGELTVWGSIAQFWRGPVGTGGGGGTGYIKNYTYDQRLATEQPPSFLSPISTSWKLSRESEVPNSFEDPSK
jgi:hypothetical protein